MEMLYKFIRLRSDTLAIGRSDTQNCRSVMSVQWTDTDDNTSSVFVQKLAFGTNTVFFNRNKLLLTLVFACDCGLRTARSTIRP